MKLFPLIAAVFCTALLCVALRVGVTTSRTVADGVVGPSLSAAPATRVGSPPSPVRDLSSHRPHPSSHPHACTDRNWLTTLGTDERWIDQRESTLNPASREPTTGAYGLGQLLPSTYALLGLPMSPDPCAQIAAQRAYLDQHYGGSWRAARTHWEVNRWW